MLDHFDNGLFPHSPEVVIYKRKQGSKKERNHVFDKESDQEKKKKGKKARFRPRK